MPQLDLPKAVRSDTTFQDPEGVLRYVRRLGDFKPLYAEKAVVDITGPRPKTGWFRTLLDIPALRASDDGDFFERELLFNRSFIEGSKESFDAAIVVPTSLAINVSSPAPSTNPHRDVHRYRTVPEIPHYMHALLLSSELFEAWSIRQSSALAWFYPGPGGEFEYWPHGPDAPSERVGPPMHNVSLVSDNNYMFHRICAVGNEPEYLDDTHLSEGSQIFPVGDRDWEVRDGEIVQAALPREHVRVAIVWKANVFRSETERQRVEDSRSVLTVREMVNIFCQDLTTRGIRFSRPDNPFNDQRWDSILRETYPIYAAPR